MAGILEQLRQDRHAVLLLHLAGELSPQDEAQVLQAIQEDAGLRLDLAELQKAQERVYGALASLDAREPITEAAARAAARAIAQQRQPRSPAAPVVVQAEAKERLRVGWWIYPVAVAAMVLIAFIAWIGKHNLYLPHARVARDGKTAVVNNEPPDIVMAASDPFAVPIAAAGSDAGGSLNDAADQLTWLSGHAQEDDVSSILWTEPRQ